MGNFMRGVFPSDDSKQIIVKDLASVNNYILLEGSQSEQFALEVARELVTNASKDQVRDAIQSVMRKRL